MSNDIKELQHALDIIQNKIKACHQEQCHIINRMSTKRTLLRETVGVLQNDLCFALEQDFHKKRTVKSARIEQQLEPIIGTFEGGSDNNSAKERLNLVQCKGWIRDKRVWIQAQGCSLSNDIYKVQLNLVPNKYLPQKIHLDTLYDVKENATIQLFATFDLLDDVLDLNGLKVACIVNDIDMTTSTCDIEWINGIYDLSWKDQMLSILASDVIQAYFPCHLRIMNHSDNDQIINSLNTVKLQDHLFLSDDQSFIIELIPNDNDYFNLYGLNNRIVAKIASLFPNISLSNSLVTKKELIQSLGDQYVTLEHNHLNKARLHTALILSELSK